MKTGSFGFLPVSDSSHLQSAPGITKVAFSAVPAGLDRRVPRLPRLEEVRFQRQIESELLQRISTNFVSARESRGGQSAFSRDRFTSSWYPFLSS